jgi:hypothetical protein
LVPVTLLTMGEAAQRYQVRPARLQTLIRDGRIRTVQLEGQDLIPDEDVAMVAGQTQNGNGNGHWIPLAEAIALHPEVDPAVLEQLARHRVLTSRRPVGEEMLVDREEVEAIARRLDRRQWQQFAGRKISLSDAAQRYNLRKVTLSKWARAGHIRVLERDSYRVYLDEADVNFAAALAQIANRPGRSLFPR